jgi:drug/metabolite transporter (DMT)-like permease
MVKSKGKIFIHAVALLIVVIWGTTFVSTKVLILNGLSPAQIFLLRFVIAYFAMLLVGFLTMLSRKNGGLVESLKSYRLFSSSWCDELVMALLGITGGSVYFLTENEALRYSTASNVSLIVCVTPLMTSLLNMLFFRTERMSACQLMGSLVACAGMILVVLNGHFILHLSPLGDTLALSACLCWAVYSLLMKRVTMKYSPMFITRKVFFYGVLTILPYYFFVPAMPAANVLLRPSVIWNLLFLGMVASFFCFLTWNWCIEKIGAVKSTNYIYFNPVSTLVAAWIFLSEQITVYCIAGAAMIILGMYFAENVEKRKIKQKLNNI